MVSRAIVDGPSAHSREHAWAVAATVTDPEVPVLTIEDLGVLRDVEVDGDRASSRSPRPTAAAPRSTTMRDDVILALTAAGYEHGRRAHDPLARLDHRLDDGCRQAQARRVRHRPADRPRRRSRRARPRCAWR